MKRQKIKRYQFSIAQGTRRRRTSSPLKTAAVVLLGFCVITGAVYGVGRAVRSASGWSGEGAHKYYTSPATGLRAKGLYEVDHKLYYFGTSGFAKIGWVREDGFVGYASQDGVLLQGEAEVDGTSYYFQPGTGQLYTGWVTLDGETYCFDDTGHPRTGNYQENGCSWQLDENGRVLQRLDGWKNEDGVLKYYNEDGTPAQGWMQLGGKDYCFVDGVSQAGWAQTDEGLRYLDGNGSKATGWQVIDGQPTAFAEDGSLKQGWDHAHGKSYYFVDGISQSGVFQEGRTSYDLDGSGGVQPAAEVTPEEDLAEDAEGEPPEESLTEELPSPQEETAPAAEPAQPEETPVQEPEAAPAEPETAEPQEQGEGAAA